ncbi:MAG: hypothetical protein IJT43_05850 [Stomatobaculum sp.]|nr:hypothetical protein [Stomatobaculum sp.]
MTKSRTKKKTGPGGGLYVLLFFLAALLFAGGYVYRNYGPVKKYMAEEDLFSVSGDRIAIMYGYELQKAAALMEDGEVYLPCAFVQTILNRRFYWDEDEEILSYVEPEGVRRIHPGDKGKDGKKLFFLSEGKPYLSAALVLEYTGIRLERFTDGEVKRIFVMEPPAEDTVADAKSRTVLRSGKSWRKPITAEVPKDAVLRLIPDHPGMGEGTKEDQKWQRVMTNTGVTGYIMKSRLKNERQEEYKDSFVPAVYPSFSLGKPVVLGWHQVSVAQANKYLGEAVSGAECLNVVSPTWFTLKGNEGEFESRSSRLYVEEAHKAGLQVWALVDNLDASVTLGTLLKKTSVRQKLIDGLMEEAETCGFDGINLDFELLRKDAVDQYLEFVREMYAACREKNLILSVDVPNFASYNWHYTREELAVFCDYVINMGYDEHTAGDSAGSTASIGFFQEGLEETLEEVPAEKLVGGVPFYTRVWRVNGGETSSEAMTMKGAAEWVQKNQVKLFWDEELGQYRGSIQADDGGERLIWMEDARSMELKVNALKEYRTVGIACWRLGQETKDIWEVIGGFLK